MTDNYIAPTSTNDKNIPENNLVDLDTMILKFYRVNKNSVLIKSGSISLKELSYEELTDIKSYIETNEIYQKSKVSKSNLETLTMQQLINLKAYFKVNKIN